VRLRYACLIRCTEVIKDERGEVQELRCTWDPATWGGNAPDGRSVRGTLHWVSAAQSMPAEVRLYDRLFSVESPGADPDKNFLDELNPESMTKLEGCRMEAYLATGAATPGTRFQFERLGYFSVDPDSGPEELVWNRIVGLRDTWAKLEAKAPAKPAAKAEPKPKQDKKAPKPAAEPPAEIGIDELGRVDLRVGVVREAEIVKEADKLLRLMVDLGEGRLRQIFTGLRAYYPDPAALVGQRVVVVANLKPRQMKFGVSEGMILAAGGDGRPHRIATFGDAADDPQPGDKIT
jgi:methionine--tRNA ligase beta chain